MNQPREEVVALAKKIREFMKQGDPVKNTPKGLPEQPSSTESLSTDEASNIPEVATWQDTVTGSGGGPEF